MARILILIGVIFVYAISTWASGGEVGNGGDLIFCKSGAASNKDIFSFDAYIARTRETVDMQIFPSRSNKAIDRLTQIANILQVLSPELAKDLLTFSQDVFQGLDYTRRHVWIPSNDPLAPIDDQFPEILVDPACRVEGSDKPNLFQAVVRNARPQVTTYYFNTKAIQNLNQEPIDLAFLLLHEWLWDYTSDVRALRQLNFLLNSTWLLRANPEEFQRTWSVLTDAPAPPPAPPSSNAQLCELRRIDGSVSNATTLTWSECLDFFDQNRDKGAAPAGLFFMQQQVLGQISYANFICVVELAGGTLLSPSMRQLQDCVDFLSEQNQKQPESSKPVRAYFDLDKIL